MSMMMLLLTMKMMKNMNPIKLSIMILMMSLMSAGMMFKNTMSSWISLVTILTFSSGMMTLFMYTASMNSNEVSKQKNNKMMTIIIMMMMMTPLNQTKTMKKTMKMFTSQKMMMVMGTMLIMALMAISTHGHHPNQTLSSSF